MDFSGRRHFWTARYGINRTRLEGVDTKNRTNRTWGVYAFIGGGGGEVCKFKFKVGGALE